MCNLVVGGHARSRPTGSGLQVVSRAWIAGPPVAEEDAPRKPQKADAGDARTASDCRATSSASGAATTAMPSARRSAGTPSTRPPSTSSRPSPTRHTARATSTWELVLGTGDRRLNPRQLTGARCQTQCRSRTANGSARCGIRGGGIGAADPISTPGRATALSALLRLLVAALRPLCRPMILRPSHCPSSRAIVCRASASMRRLAPVSERCDGPPATGAFQPVSSSYREIPYAWRRPVHAVQPLPALRSGLSYTLSCCL